MPRDKRPRYLFEYRKAHYFADTLKAARQLGIQTINFSTDDPWNPIYKARWALNALKSYDFIGDTSTYREPLTNASTCSAHSLYPIWLFTIAALLDRHAREQ